LARAGILDSYPEYLTIQRKSRYFPVFSAGIWKQARSSLQVRSVIYSCQWFAVALPILCKMPGFRDLAGQDTLEFS